MHLMCLELGLAYSKHSYMIVVVMVIIVRSMTLGLAPPPPGSPPDCPRFNQAALWVSSEPSVTSFRAHLAQGRDFERKNIL